MRHFFQNHKNIILAGVAVFLLQFLVFLVFLHFFGYQGFTRNQSDALGYVKIAQNIISHSSFAQQDLLLPDALRTPIYPLYISFFLIITGSYAGAVFFQLCFIAISASLIAYVAEKYGYGRIGMFAGILFGCDPNVLYWTNQTMTEPLFTLILIALVILFWFWYERRTTALLSLLSIVLAIETLVRPVTQFLPIFIIVLIIMEYKKGIRHIAKSLIVFISIFLLCLSPWLIRNYIKFQTITLSQIGVHNLYFYHVQPVLIQKGIVGGDIDSYKMFENILLSKYAVRANLSDNHEFSTDYVKFSSLISKESIILAENYPADVANIYWGGIQKFLFDQGGYDHFISIFIKYFSDKFIFIKDWLLIATAIYWKLIWIFFVLSVYYYRKDYRIITMASLVIYFMVLSGGASDSRLRIPVLPFILFVAGVGVRKFALKIKRITYNNLMQNS